MAPCHIFGDQSIDRYIERPSRQSIRQPFLLIDPVNAIASVVLFPGASGYLGLTPDDTIHKLSRNFLILSRYLFAKAGLRVTINDRCHVTPPVYTDKIFIN